MQKTKSVKLNMVMNAILTMSSMIFPLITFPYVSRILLPVGVGRVNFAYSIVTYFSMFAQLGIPTYGIRACAKVRDNKEELSRIVHELIVINVITCIISYVIFFISIITIDRLKNDYILFFIMCIIVFLNAIGVEWLYKALEQYKYITVRSVVFKFIAVISMFMFVHEQKDYVVYGFIVIFASSASNVFNFFNLKKYIYVKNIGSYNFKRHFKMILVFFAMSIATTIYTNLDNVMLGFMTNDEQVGFYGAAVKIKNLLISLVTSSSAVLLPRTSYYVDKGLKTEFIQLVRKTMHFVLVLSIPLCVYFLIFAKQSILFLSGEAYHGSIVPMMIIMPTLVFCGITNIIGIQLMIPLGLEKKVLYSEIAGAITDLMLNGILIQKYGASGAAFGTLIAEMVVFIWQWYSIKSLKYQVFSDTPFFLIVISCIVCSILTIAIRLVSTNNTLTLISSAMVFFSFYGIILICKKDELAVSIVKQIKTKLDKR